MAKEFLTKYAENADLNQYWYSERTIEALVAELVDLGVERIAFVSTPSLYFALPDGAAKEHSKFFDIDKDMVAHPNGVQYDFNSPEAFPDELRGFFQCVVVDPPFITRDAYEKYARTVKLLLPEDGSGKIVLSTIAENAGMLEELLGVRMQAFQPSIPNLVYQYNMFCNYDSERLGTKNPEIPD
mmetsp:Transcript_58980/g.140827  ORF Transcript_58980/g.140827 Transcript_58980/m.140827 type:complete len:184 (+) Transcript_58980:113-664(+)